MNWGPTSSPIKRLSPKVTDHRNQCGNYWKRIGAKRQYSAGLVMNKNGCGKGTKLKKYTVKRSELKSLL